jgi:hypothetical protein
VHELGTSTSSAGERRLADFSDSFMETGHRKAARLDFDYKRPLEPGGPDLMNHYLKLVSRQAYWNHLASGMF